MARGAVRRVSRSTQGCHRDADRHGHRDTDTSGNRHDTPDHYSRRDGGTPGPGDGDANRPAHGDEHASRTDGHAKLAVMGTVSLTNTAPTTIAAGPMPRPR